MPLTAIYLLLTLFVRAFLLTLGASSLFLLLVSIVWGT